MEIKEDRKVEDMYIGKVYLNRYEVEKRIGQGAFGSVYLVLDIEIKAK